MYLKRGARDCAEPVLNAEKERAGKRLEMPKLSTQNAPTRGRRRRIVAGEDRARMALALQESVEAIWEKQLVCNYHISVTRHH